MRHAALAIELQLKGKGISAEDNADVQGKREQKPPCATDSMQVVHRAPSRRATTPNVDRRMRMSFLKERLSTYSRSYAMVSA